MPNKTTIFALFAFSILILILTCFYKNHQITDENRAYNLFKVVKCMVCSGETISEANTSFAENMKTRIRERIAEGENDEKILADIKSEYGDAIVLDSNLHSRTYVLWVAPIFLLLLGFYYIIYRRI